VVAGLSAADLLTQKFRTAPSSSIVCTDFLVRVASETTVSEIECEGVELEILRWIGARQEPFTHHDLAAFDLQSVSRLLGMLLDLGVLVLE
jgi:hypothetical protein